VNRAGSAFEHWVLQKPKSAQLPLPASLSARPCRPVFTLLPPVLWSSGLCVFAACRSHAPFPQTAPAVNRAGSAFEHWVLQKPKSAPSQIPDAARRDLLGS
jgi:hypothetical protein